MLSDADVKTVTADSLQKGMAFGVPFSLTHVCSESFRPATHIPPAVVRDSTRVVIPFRPAVGKSKQASIARSLARSHCPRPASEAGTFRASVQHPRGATKRHPSGHWRALRCTAAHTATNGQARESVIYTSCEASESCVCVRANTQKGTVRTRPRIVCASVCVVTLKPPCVLPCVLLISRVVFKILRPGRRPQAPPSEHR